MDKVVRPVFLLTDFGARDHYVGQLRGVLATLAPGVHVHDISHEVEPFAIDEGAWLLETSLGSLPLNAVILAVVDPGVGSERKALVVESGGRVFVGPDNGLLSPAFSTADREAGQSYARDRTVREVVPASGVTASPTFHGRDVFAPAAASIAAGMAAADVGPACDARHLLPPFRGEATLDGFAGRVIHIDRYGNLVTSVTAEQAGVAYSLEVAGVTIDGPARTFSDVPSAGLLTHIDSSGFVAVAQNLGNAAASLGVGRRAPVRVTPR